MHTDTHANSIFDGPMITLLSVLGILVEILSRALVKRGKAFMISKFGTFIGRFPSDDVASTAVKGLIQMDRYTDIDIYKRLHGGWLGW